MEGDHQLSKSCAEAREVRVNRAGRLSALPRGVGGKGDGLGRDSLTQLERFFPAFELFVEESEEEGDERSAEEADAGDET